MFWGVEHLSMREAFVESGSALLTLGLTRPGSLPGVALAFIEAGIGLFLLALLITYLPSIYAAFSRRELGVTALEIRAGSPPSGRTLIWRFWALQRMEHLNGVWLEWERWFVDVEETHTSLPAVAFFRSPQPDHHWVTAAGAVLDGAALAVSTVDIERDVQAEFCLRAGYLCLRRIADFYNFAHDPDPHPDDPISITRSEWEEAVASLEEAGVPLKADRDLAWRDFSGWRVNYDSVLLALANLTSAPPAPWSSDRSGARPMRPRCSAARGSSRRRSAERYVPGLSTMSATIKSSSTMSRRDTRKIRARRRCTSGSSGPFSVLSVESLPDSGPRNAMPVTNVIRNPAIASRIQVSEKLQGP